MGSYFGSSLCAVDLNADGLSDLLVGAPMFSEIRDEGQVTVYINRGNVSTELGDCAWGWERDVCMASSDWAPLWAMPWTTSSQGGKYTACLQKPPSCVPLVESYVQC